MFVGTHEVPLDARGRFSIPAGFRARLASPVVYVWPSYRGAWLEAGDETYLAVLQAELDSRGAFDEGRTALEYAIFGEARALTLDDTGRAQLPGDLRAHAGIGEKAAFVGLSKRFEIWAPEALKDRKQQARASAGAKP